MQCFPQVLRSFVVVASQGEPDTLLVSSGNDCVFATQEAMLLLCQVGTCTVFVVNLSGIMGGLP